MNTTLIKLHKTAFIYLFLSVFFVVTITFSLGELKAIDRIDWLDVIGEGCMNLFFLIWILLTTMSRLTGRVTRLLLTGLITMHISMLLDFIDELPDGLQTWLGSTGIGLSGGQIQRLQIAQLLLRSASVLILDEPTKGLDRINEQAVMENILAHVDKHNQSLLVITHKPLMLEKMDKIIVMEQGRIIAQGNHKELASNNQYYQTLLNYF